MIYCSSFTKSYAPSFRLGWIAGGRHHEALARLQAAIGEILAAVREAGLGIVDLSTEETDLEDIFLQLTATRRGELAS